MPYDAILFDLDGTLADTITLYGHAVLRSLREIGVEATEKEFFEWYTYPLHLKQILGLYSLDESHVPALRTRRDVLYERMLETQTEWLRGGEELLRTLRDRKTPTAIVTGSWMRYIDAIDRKLGIKRYVETYVTADDIHKFMKPHPHGLLLACDRLGAEPGRCLYVGDQQFDIDAAKAAGMPCWLIPGRWSPKTMTGAERTFMDPRGVLEALR